MSVLLAWILFGVLAPEPVADPRREQAAAAFAEGTAAFDRGDPATALLAFERAQSLMPHPKVLSNIAVCLADLGRYREAVAALEVVLAGGDLAPAERTVAQAHLARVRAQLATLHITADTAIEIEIDGGARCTTPCALTLDPGAHEIAATSQGYTTRVELGGGSTTRMRVPSPALAAVPRPAIDHVPPPPPRGAPKSVRFGAMGWTGVALGALGGAATLGFGLRARALHRDYLAMPDDEVRADGITARNLANASIAMAAAGGVLLIAELIRFGRARRGHRGAAVRGSAATKPATVRR